MTKSLRQWREANAPYLTDRELDAFLAYRRERRARQMTTGWPWAIPLSWMD